MAKKQQISLVKSSSKLRATIKSRMEQLALKPTDIINDARARGVTLDKSGFSKYLNNKKTSAISEENLIWLCIRYGIPIKLEIGSIDKFDEYKALELLYKIFPSKCHTKEDTTSTAN